MARRVARLDNPVMSLNVPLGARVLLVAALAILIAPAVAGCGGAEDHAAWTAAPIVHAPATDTTSGEAPGVVPAAHAATWAARPAYVRSHPVIEEAYAFALARPDVVKWLPCYCGCVAMDHRSNLDCFFKPTMEGLEPVFEEHASFCDVCIETALMAKQMLAQGESLRAIRDAVDATFGGRAPGTITQLPPA
jgi:hypothetical protein